MKYNIFELAFLFAFFVMYSCDNTPILIAGAIIMSVSGIYIIRHPENYEDDEYEYIEDYEDEEWEDDEYNKYIA